MGDFDLFLFSSFFFFGVWLCGWSCKSFYLWENGCLSNWFFSFKEPLYSTHDITNLSRFMTGKPLANFPLIFMFAGVCRQCFSVSGFVFLFPISPIFFLISVSGFVFLFPVSGCFSFLFFVSLSVFLFPVSVFLFSFLLSFWVVFLFLVAGIYFSNFWFCFF